jgi:fumarate hydratase class I
MAYVHAPLFPLGKDDTSYRQIGSDGVAVERVGGREILSVTREAMRHLAQLAKILDDPEATANDKFVAYDLLKNANIADCATRGEPMPADEPPRIRELTVTLERDEFGLNR